MKINNSCKPDTATGIKLAEHDTIPRFGDKRDVGEMAGGFSKRWVDDQLALGMPHLKLGQRRVRFDLAEVREWLRQKYHVQRRAAPQKASAAP